jgi:stage II sporulation protein D
MEDYVQSVVGGEIPDGWPLECLKAQAIAARSYAGYRLRLTRDSPARDYEKDFRTVAAGGVLIWAGTSDQVYRGIGEESAQSVDATRATRGKMLTYGGAPIGAYFCSDAGGMTEDPRYVWGGSKPYLQAVREVPHDSPYSSWTVALDEASLAEGLGQLDIELAGVPDMIAGYEPGVSGRWTGVTVGSASGLQTVKSGDFRRVFPQVRSMLFSSFAVGGGEASRGQVGAEMEVFVQADGKVAPSVKIGASVLLGDDGRAARNCRGAVVVSGVTEQAPVTYIIQGRGWGHGVGLSQYGAKAMALSGQDAAAILKLYFPGTVLDQWWQ